MPKSPRVIGVLTEPPTPTWWRANRHKVLLILGLLAGYYVGTHFSDAPAHQPSTPRPGHTAPTTPGPLHSTHTFLGTA
ncbi:hypothetical protein [Streptomyces griseorubiginosus]|uniref:hypothetical protein n=1 Tax=Streptomyces griseorubiginosus TaxID=67304 RepID=UPI0036E01C9C